MSMLVAVLQHDWMKRKLSISSFTQVQALVCSLCSCSVTVGASDINDNLASFSNYGKCVDIIAPVRYIIASYMCVAMYVCVCVCVCMCVCVCVCLCVVQYYE